MCFWLVCLYCGVLHMCVCFTKLPQCTSLLWCEFPVPWSVHLHACHSTPAYCSIQQSAFFRAPQTRQQDALLYPHTSLCKCCHAACSFVHSQQKYFCWYIAKKKEVIIIFGLIDCSAAALLAATLQMAVSVLRQDPNTLWSSPTGAAEGGFWERVKAGIAQGCRCRKLHCVLALNRRFGRSALDQKTGTWEEQTLAASEGRWFPFG